MGERTSGVAAKNRIISYTVKKRIFVTVVAVVLGIAAICLAKIEPVVPFIAIPVIIAVAFVADKLLIVLRPDVYGRDMLKRGRNPVIATCTVVAAFTLISLISGVVSFQLVTYDAEDAMTVGTYDTIDEAIGFLQKSGLEDKYVATVYLTTSSKQEFTVSVTFTAKDGDPDINDFEKYGSAVLDGNGGVKVSVKGYRISYGGSDYTYYVLNKDHLKSRIEITDGEIRVVDNDPVRAFGMVLGATFGAVIQLVIIVVIYVAGIIAAIVPSEIYFEKLIRAEARKAARSDNAYGSDTADMRYQNNTNPF